VVDRRKWRPEEDAVVVSHYISLGAKRVSEMLPGRTANAVHQRAQDLGIKANTTWEPWMVELLRHVYPDGGTWAMQRWLPDCSRRSISSAEHRFGVPPAYSTRGRSTRFYKGMESINKGLRMTREQREKVKHTWFKKGEQNSPKVVPVGTVSIQNGKRLVKIHNDMYGNRDNWKLESHLVWEAHNGPLKPGEVVCNIHPNPPEMHVNDIRNLRLLTRAELAVQATQAFKNYPPELQKAIRTLSQLKQAIKRQEEHEHEK
jgi:hypothetical protein